MKLWDGNWGTTALSLLIWEIMAAKKETFAHHGQKQQLFMIICLKRE